VQHDKNLAAAEEDGVVAGVFAAQVPVRTHIAREPTAVARVAALVADGNMKHMWQKTGTIAINGWQAFAVHDGIVAKEAKVAATKTLELAAANEAVVVAASALALQLGDEPDAVMKGAESTLAIKFVYVAFPLQPTPRSSHSSKAAGSRFSAGFVLAGPLSFPLPAPRASLPLLRRLLMMPRRMRLPRRLNLLAPRLRPSCCLPRTVRRPSSSTG